MKSKFQAFIIVSGGLRPLHFPPPPLPPSYTVARLCRDRPSSLDRWSHSSWLLWDELRRAGEVRLTERERESQNRKKGVGWLGSLGIRMVEWTGGIWERGVWAGEVGREVGKVRGSGGVVGGFVGWVGVRRAGWRIDGVDGSWMRAAWTVENPKRASPTSLLHASHTRGPHTWGTHSSSWEQLQMKHHVIYICTADETILRLYGQ